MESPAAEKRQMSIAQWRALAGEGTVIPMRIPLEGDSMRPLIRRGHQCSAPSRPSMESRLRA